MTVLDELGALPERIAASRDRIEDLEQATDTEREIRNQLIVQAVDEAGIPQAQVARAAGLSQPQIIRILAKSSAD